jgi:subtilisin family serine protease
MTICNSDTGMVPPVCRAPRPSASLRIASAAVSLCVLRAILHALSSAAGEGPSQSRAVGLCAILRWALLIFLVTARLFSYQANAQPSENGGALSAPDRLIIKLKVGQLSDLRKSSGTTKAALSDLRNLNKLYGVSDCRSIDFGPGGALGSVQLITLPRNCDVGGLTREYEKLEIVEYVEPDRQMELFLSPNDPLYSRQWSLHNTGQAYWAVARRPGFGNDELVLDSGLAGADIAADSVFANLPDGTSVVVAIIDTGIDFSCPEIAGRIWINTREIANNGADDDHNGYVDDISGWDYSGNDTTLIPVFDDNDPTDHHGHGTHVAGIISAATNNAIGIAGIVPRCKIMPLKFYPMMFTSSAARAVVYAADNGAGVINMSWGSPFPSRLLEDALTYARSKGVVLCAATGNSGKREGYYPALLTSTIAVGATDSRDRVTSFSTFGPYIDLVAPGESILSLHAAGTDMYALPPANEPNVHIIQGDYYEASGTSMACPHVAAVAAYLKSVSPGLTPTMTQTIMQQAAKDLTDPYGNGESYPGPDVYSGYGRINLSRSLSLAPAQKAVIEIPLHHQILSGLVDIQGLAAGTSSQGYTVDYGPGNDPSVWYTITSAVTPVLHASLARWNTDSLNGPFTLRLRVGEFNEAKVNVFVANRDYCEIVSPPEGDTVATSDYIFANISSPDFLFATLEYGMGRAPVEWVSIDTFTVPHFQERIVEWNSSALAEGYYTLRLALRTARGISSDTVVVYVRSPFSGPNGWRKALAGVATIVPNYGDFDGDGRNEIIVGTSNGVRFFNPDGTVCEKGMPVLPPYNFRTPIAVGKLDSDGIDDFAAISQNPCRLFIYSSQTGLRQESISVALDVAKFDANEEMSFPVLFLEDINGDGRDEIHFLSTHVLGGWAQRYTIWNSDGMELAPGHFEDVVTCLPVDLSGDGVDEICCYFDSLYEYDVGGNRLASLSLNLATQFTLKGVASVDVDNDGRRELLVFGRYSWSENLDTYWLFAFGDQLSIKPTWPREIRINRTLVPNMPVFGDIDDDSMPEYVTTCWDLNYGYLYAWRHNGQPYFGDSTSTGFFASANEPSMFNMPILADIDAANGAEIITCALPDAWGVSNKQSIFAWNKGAQLLTGWPLTVVTGAGTKLDYANTPVVGDVNQDGNVDMMMTTAKGDLVFINFPDRPIRAGKFPCPIWRYNRRLNNQADLWPTHPTAVDDGDEDADLPSQFSLEQNYPNPFNGSTTIAFSLRKPEAVRIEILDILGRLARSYELGVLPGGRHSIEWDSKNDGGQPVSSGIYFCRLSIGEAKATRKILLLK